MTDNLLPVFAGSAPVFAADTVEVVELLAGRGLDTIGFDDMLRRPPAGVVLVVQDLDTMRRRHDEMRRATASSRVVLVPACSFDPSLAAIDYTLDLLLTSDFERAVARTRAWSDVLHRQPSPLVFRSPGDPDAELRVHLLGDLKVAALTEVELAPGDWTSVARFFEVEVEVFDSKAHYFSLDGTLAVRGMLTARSANMPAELEHLHAGANKVVHDVSGRAGRLVAVDNRLESFVVDGADLADDVYELSGRLYDRNFVEFAIGTNSPAIPVRWDVNSCLNEGLDGVHVAIGDGIGGAHLDFVAPGTRLVL